MLTIVVFVGKYSSVKSSIQLPNYRFLILRIYNSTLIIIQSIHADINIIVLLREEFLFWFVKIHCENRIMRCIIANPFLWIVVRFLRYCIKYFCNRLVTLSLNTLFILWTGIVKSYNATVCNNSDSNLIQVITYNFLCSYISVF
jgi:hypothetical protein